MIDPMFWSDPDFDNIENPDVLMVYLYLISNDHTNCLGIYVLSWRKAVHELRMDKVRIANAFEALTGKVYYDSATDYVWIVGYFGRQFRKIPHGNMVKSVYQEIEKLNDSTCPFKEPFYGKYSRLTTLFTRAFKDLTKPHGKGKGKEKGKEKEQEKEIGIPEGYLTETEKKAQKVKNNTQLMVRIGTWFGRRPTTLWTVYEAEAFLRLDIDEDEDFVMLEQYYTADAKDFDRDYRRRDLGTLLNNWNTELDRARAWRSGNNRPDDGRPGGKYVRPA